MNMDFLIEPEQLAAELGNPNLRLVDASWYLPSQNRNGRAEYVAVRLPGAVFFDIEAIADRSSGLPHMLPSPSDFARAVGEMGIGDADDIVVYDGPGIFSSARVWWTFRIMGANRVRILAGGIDGWRKAGLPVETGTPPRHQFRQFTPRFAPERVATMEHVLEAIDGGRVQILDARPFRRFCGLDPEPRAGLRSGHMPGAQPLPWDRLVTNGRLKDREALLAEFREVATYPERPVITSCGSGVTAAIISLALETIGHPSHRLYDGSWAQWGQEGDTPIAQWLEGKPPTP